MASQPKQTSAVTPHGRHRDEWGLEFSRIVAFSDGVFAIAITLLVLALDVPENAPDLVDSLLRQRGDIVAYAISFAVLGRLWLAHHRFFSALERFDGRLMALNLIYLAFIALVPFTSEVLGDYPQDSAAVVLYAGALFGVSLVFAIQIVYSYRMGLVKRELHVVERRYAGPMSFLVAAVFFASMLVALVAPLAAMLMWLLIFAAGNRVSDRIAEYLGDRQV